MKYKRLPLLCQRDYNIKIMIPMIGATEKVVLYEKTVFK
jgi:hypothetical protein